MVLREGFIRLEFIRDAKLKNGENMLRELWTKVLLIFILITICSCKSEKTEQQSSNSNEFLDVCKLSENPDMYNGRFVKVSGKIKGYHQIVFYSNDCVGEKNIVLLDFDYNTFKELLMKSVTVRNVKGENDLTGNLVLFGKFEKGTGKVTNYGKIVIDTANNTIIEKPRDITTNQITNIRVDSFTPE